MVRRADFNPALGRKAARQPQHLGAVALHWEIAQRSRIHGLANVYGPAEYRMQRTGEHGLIDGGIGPTPKGRIGLAVNPQQVASQYRRLSDPQRQTLGFHAILYGQYR